MNKPGILLLMPVYNDWSSAEQLLMELDGLLSSKPIDGVQVLLVDDASVEEWEADFPTNFSSIAAVQILRLRVNLGHQKAIAIGLSYAFHHIPHEALLVMDSDGEDKPEDVLRLMDSFHNGSGEIGVGSRRQRTEGAVFQLGYAFYKSIFQALTGKGIDFGNFVIIPKKYLANLIYSSEIWCHFAATIVKSKLPVVKIPVDRGTRYAGVSSMNLVSLVTHGFSAVAVYLEVVFTRLFFACLALLGVSVALGTVAILIRTFSHLAIPGWATVAVGISALLALQTLSLMVVMLFSHLAGRKLVHFVPGADYQMYVDTIVETGRLKE